MADEFDPTGIEEQEVSDVDAVDDTNRAAMLKMSVGEDFKKTPAEAVQDRNLGKQFDVKDDGFVSRNRKELQELQKISTVNYDKIVKKYPGLARFFSKPNNAAIAQNDIPKLQKMEETSFNILPNRTQQSTLDKYYKAVSRGQKIKDPTIMEQAGMSVIRGGLRLGKGSLHGLGLAHDALMWLYLKSKGKESEFPEVRKATREIESKATAPLEKRIEALTTPEVNRSITENIIKGNWADASETAFLLAVEQIPQLILMVAGSATIGAGKALGGLAGISAGEAYEESRAEGKTPKQAFTHAAASGGFEFLGEKVTMGLMNKMRINSLKAVETVGKEQVKASAGKFFGNIAAGVAQEASAEAFTEAGQNFSDYMTGDANALDGATIRILDAGIVGGLVGGGLGTVGSAVQAVTPQATEVSKENLVRLTDEYGQAVKQSEDSKKLKKLGEEYRDLGEIKNAKGAVKELFEDMSPEGEDAKVYMQPDDFDTYFNKKKINPEDVIGKMSEDVKRSYEEAKAAGKDFEIPMGEFLEEFADSEDFDSLSDIAKTVYDGINNQEAQEVMGKLGKEISELSKKSEEEAPTIKSIKDDVKRQLRNAGVPTDQMNAVSELTALRYKRRGEVLEVDPLELYKKDNLRINRFKDAQSVPPDGGIVYKEGELSVRATPRDIGEGFYSPLESFVQNMQFPKKGMDKQQLLQTLRNRSEFKREMDFREFEYFFNSRFKDKDRVTKKDIETLLSDHRLGPFAESITQAKDRINIQNDVSEFVVEVKEKEFGHDDELDISFKSTSLTRDHPNLDMVIDGIVNLMEIDHGALKIKFKDITTDIHHDEQPFMIEVGDNGWFLYDPKSAEGQDSYSFLTDNPNEAMVQARGRLAEHFDDDQMAGGYEEHTVPGGYGYKEWVFGMSGMGLTYESDHYKGIENYIFHVRRKLRDRHGKEGRIYSVEEVQSDLAKDPGYGKDFPYKKSWISLAAKFILKDAVNSGSDIIAIVPAITHAERWGDEYLDAYKRIYDKELPRAIEKAIKEYGFDVKADPENVDFVLASETTRGGGKTGSIGTFRTGTYRLSPELKNKIRKELISFKQSPLAFDSGKSVKDRKFKVKFLELTQGFYNAKAVNLLQNWNGNKLEENASIIMHNKEGRDEMNAEAKRRGIEPGVLLIVAQAVEDIDLNPGGITQGTLEYIKKNAEEEIAKETKENEIKEWRVNIERADEILNYIQSRPKTFKQSGLSDRGLGFYSRLEEAVLNHNQKEMPASDWIKYLKSDKRQLKREELDYTGVVDWLTGKGEARVKREDLAKLVRDQNMVMSQVVFGDVRKTTADDYAEMFGFRKDKEIIEFEDLSEGQQEEVYAVAYEMAIERVHDVYGDSIVTDLENWLESNYTEEELSDYKDEDGYDFFKIRNEDTDDFQEFEDAEFDIEGYYRRILNDSILDNWEDEPQIMEILQVVSYHYAHPEGAEVYIRQPRDGGWYLEVDGDVVKDLGHDLNKISFLNAFEYLDREGYGVPESLKEMVWDEEYIHWEQDPENSESYNLFINGREAQLAFVFEGSNKTISLLQDQEHYTKTGRIPQEILNRLEKKDPKAPSIDHNIEQSGAFRPEWNITENLKNVREIGVAIKKDGDTEPWIGSHHGSLSPNEISHFRIHDMNIDNKKTMFIEEIQSDLHRAGQKRGYRKKLKKSTRRSDDEIEADIEKLTKNPDSYEADAYKQLKDIFETETSKDWNTDTVNKALEERGNESGSEIVRTITLKDGPETTDFSFSFRPWHHTGNTWDSFITNIREKHPETFNAILTNQALAQDTALQRERNDGSIDDDKIPDLPFKADAWQEMTIRRILRIASEEGYEAVGWLDGDGQARRWKSTISRGGGWLRKENPDNPKAPLISWYIPTALVKSPGQTQEELIKEIEGHSSWSDKRTRMSDFEEMFKVPEVAKKQFEAFQKGEKFGMNVPKIAGWQKIYDKNTPKIMKKLLKNAPERKVISTETGSHGTWFVEIPQKTRDKLKKKQPLMQHDRGQIRITDRQIDIDLFENADPSTLLHETGHLWLEQINRDFKQIGGLSEQTEMQKQFIKDHDNLLKWLNQNTKGDNINSLDQLTVEHHELFARGAERYLGEGHAPTEGLKSLFAKFKAWILSVYRELKRLNAPLTDEVRGVFDRLLVAEEEMIEKEQDTPSLVDAFRNAGVAKDEVDRLVDAMDKARVEAESIITMEITKAKRDKKSSKYKELENEVRSEVSREMQETEKYKLLQFIEDNKISKQSLVPFIDESDSIENYKRYTTTKDTGIHIETLVVPYQFRSVAELLRTLRNMKSYQEELDINVEDRMKDDYPDIVEDADKMEEMVQDALNNEFRARRLRKELEILREWHPGQLDKATFSAIARVPRSSEVQKQARDILSKRKIKDIRPHVYYNAEKRAAKETAKLFTRGDVGGAFNQKRMEYLNHELYREAVKIRKNIDKNKKTINKMMLDNDKKLSKNRNIDFIHAARAILANYGFGGETGVPPQEKLRQLSEYDPDAYQTIKAMIESVAVPPMNFRDMTVAEMEEVMLGVNALWDLSLSSRKMQVRGQAIEKLKALNGMHEGLTELGLKPNMAGYRKAATKWEKTKVKLLGIKSSLRRVESWVSAMDMGNADGAFRQYIYEPVNDGSLKYKEYKEIYMNKFKKLLDDYRDNLTYKEIDAPEINYTFKDKPELLGALLHTGNSSNLEKLLVGRNWGELRVDGTLNRNAWDNFMQRMYDQNIIRKADMDFIQAIWNLMEEIKRPAQVAHKNVYGFYFKEITRDPVKTPWQTYQGGYAPAKTDPFLVEEQKVRDEEAEFGKAGNSFMFPETGKGFTYQRVAAYQKPLVLDLRLFPRHLDEVLRFSFIRPRVSEVYSLLSNKKFSERLFKIDPTIKSEMLVPWLQRAAQQRVSTPPRGHGWRGVNNVARILRRRTGLNIMLGNLSVALQQLTGLSISATKVKPKHLLKGLWSYLADRKGATEAINSASLFMKNRNESQVFDINERIDEIILNPSKWDNFKQFATKHGYFMQQLTQGIVDKVTWIAAYDQATARGVSSDSATRFADSVVRETQGSYDPQDISEAEAGSDMMRLFLMFYGFFNMQGNLLGTEFQNAVRLKKGAGRMLYLYTFGFMVPAVIAGAIVQGLTREGFDEDEDDEYLDDLTMLFFRSQVSNLTALIPWVGQIGSTAINAWDDKWYNDRISTSPAISILERAVQSPKTVYKAIAEDKNKRRAVKDVLDALALASGVPLGPVARAAGYLIDVEEGNTQPEGPVDFTRGILKGR